MGSVTAKTLSLWREARGGGGEEMLGSHRRAILACTWCVREKGPPPATGGAVIVERHRRWCIVFAEKEGRVEQKKRKRSKRGTERRISFLRI